MMLGGLGPKITMVLESANTLAGFEMSLLCNDSGLLLAVAGDGADEEQIAALTALFDDIVTRAQRDLGMPMIDEVTMLDATWGRCVIRPLAVEGTDRLFLVVRVPAKSTWRRYTNILRRQITDLFASGGAA